MLIRNAQQALIAAFNGPLKEFLKEVHFDFLESAGEYDPVTDSINPQYRTEGPKLVPCLRPTVEDIDKHGVEAANTKIIIPGPYISKELETSDRVRIAGEVWQVQKTVGVPGDVIYTIFVRRT